MAKHEMTPAQKAEHSRKIKAGIAKRKRNGGKIGRPALAKGPKTPTQAKKAFAALETIDLWLLKEKLEIDLMEVKATLRDRL